MKRYLYFAVLAFAVMLCSSCKSTYTYNATFKQVVQTKSSSTSMARYDQNENAYVYENDEIRIEYDFWSEGGLTSCVITNKTNEMMFVDLDKSVLVKNNVSYAYYSSEKALLACQPVAPHTVATITGWTLGFTQYMDCSFNIVPRREAPVSVFFDATNTPASYRNITAYRIGARGEEKYVSNDFYISSITNYRSNDILVENRTSAKTVTSPCFNMNGTKTTTSSNVVVVYYKYKFSPATGFYVTYTHNVTE